MLRRIIGFAFGIGLTSVVLLAAPVAGDPTDLQLSRDVAAAVNRYTQFTIFDNVEVDVTAGFVTLTGDVTMSHKREDVERRVAQVAGVREVRNLIRVLPVSISDDQLRYRIARAIYDSPHFWNYAIGPNPPIHIIVEHGHVTLTGVVNNNTDRAIARSLATQFPAMSVTNNLKTNAELRDALATIR